MGGGREKSRVAGVAAAELVEAATVFGTPLYVIDAATVARAAAEVEAAFSPRFLLHYSLKANDLPAVAALLRLRGWGANVVSVGEWAQATAAGFEEDEITFEGVGKSDAQLEDVVEAAGGGRAVRWLVVESEEEASVLARLAGEAGLGRNRPVLDVLVRLNPAVEPETTPGLDVGSGASKFGATEDELSDVVAALERGDGLRLRGVHVHVGSQLGSVAAWAEAGVAAVRLCRRLAGERRECDTVDFGGGFPAPGSGRPAPGDFRLALDRALEAASLPLPPRAAIEPGRYLVSGAGSLLASVLHARSARGNLPLVVIDAGMTELIRPALYGAAHPVSVLASAGGGDPSPTLVEGPVCESTDSFGEAMLPPLRRGDLVVIGEAGAYGASFTSRYNGRPAPRELVRRSDGTFSPAERAPIPPHRPAGGERGRRRQTDPALRASPPDR